MKTNKNVVRLTESQLKAMIAESVANVLNEIGDTQAGQNALAQVYGRRAAKNYNTNMNQREKADNDRIMNLAGDMAWDEYQKNPNLKPTIYDRIPNPEFHYMQGFNKGVEKYTKNESRLRKIVSESIDRILKNK